MSITLIHTIDLHCATFDRLRDQIAPDTILHHHVRADWLERARLGADPELADEVRQTVHNAEGQVLCTCTTIGQIAETAGAIRVDWPMMQTAAGAGGPILMVYCLQSTLLPSSELLERAVDEAGVTPRIDLFDLTDLWPLFEAEDQDAFARSIASRVQGICEDTGDIAVVVLAQASMSGAAQYLDDLPQPVLSSPRLALEAALAC